MIKIRCSRFRRQIAAWPDLAEPARRRLREHIRVCAGCGAELEATLEIFDRLQAGREAYSKLRYAGPQPSLRGHRTLTPAEGIRTIPSRGFWRPLPVALAGGLFAVSLAAYLLIFSLPAAPPPATEPAPQPAESPAAEADDPTADGALAPEAIGPPAGMRMPSAPRRPSGLSLRLPSRPTPPEPLPPQPDAEQDPN